MATNVTMQGVKRQVTLWIWADDYRRLVFESAERKVPLNQILQECINPHLQELKSRTK